MEKNKQRQAQMKDLAKKFMLREEQGTLKQQAWEYGKNLVDWQRRVIYGLILQRLQTKQEKKAYVQQQKNEVIEQLEEMKMGVFG